MRPIIMIAGAEAGSGGHLLDKQSLVPVVQELWNAWEIHLLILASLSLQVFLFLVGGTRRRLLMWNMSLWLAYMSADAVAVFVLGHLAVRAREPGHELMSFWAPFVLVHLGGQDSITAFAKQDNDLWMRHLLNLVIQVGVAGYVVAKASWPDDRLRAAMVIMFLCGCFKYAERVLCLYLSNTKLLRGTVQNNSLFWKLVRMEQTAPAANKAERVVNKDAPTTVTVTMEQDIIDTHEIMLRGSSAEHQRPSGLLLDAREIVEDVIAADSSPLNKTVYITAAAHGGDLLPNKLSKFLSNASRHMAYEYVGALLEYCTRRLYTKDRLRLYFATALQPFGGQQVHYYPVNFKSCLRILSVPCLLLYILLSAVASSTALALFVGAHKGQLHGSNRADIIVTYALLVGALVLDVSSTSSLIFLHLMSFYLPCLSKPIIECKKIGRQRSQWYIAQYNIISTAAGMSSSPLGKRSDLDFDVRIQPTDTPFMEFILDTLLASGTRGEWHVANTRGQLAFRRWCQEHSAHSATTATSTTLESFKEAIASSADFPTSVLVLHIATDMCYSIGGTSSEDDDQEVKKHKHISTLLSNYIMYLVFKCGVMLTTYTSIVHDSAHDEILQVSSPDFGWCLGFKLLFRGGNHQEDGALKLFDEITKQKKDAHAEEIKHGDSAGSSDQNNAAATAHIEKLLMNSQTLKPPMLPHAVAVAQDLVSITKESERWKLIAEVWAEMLYYIAPRCGGDFHYQRLSIGGEFATHVLLLMYHLGPFLPPPS